MTFYSDPDLLKHGALFYPDAWESTPVAFQGNDYLVSFKRAWTGSSGEGYRVTQIGSGNPIIADFAAWAGFLGCALHDTLNGADRIVIFGVNTDASDNNEIVSSVLNSDWSAQAPVNLISAGAGQRFYNCSVCHDGTAGYLMAAEVSTGSGFSTVFYRASDIAGPWTPAGSPMPNYACPTVRKLSDGNYYCAGASGSPYRMMLARSADLISWSWSTKNVGSTILAADGPGNEGTNGSDLDISDSVVNPGTANVAYMVGDQSTWGATKLATVPMTSDAWWRGQF